MGSKITGGKIKKYIYIAFGSISLGLGILGIVLPLLPTTPFLLLSAYLFSQSSDKFYMWLTHHKVFGAYIYNYKTYKAVSRKDKIITLVVLYSSVTFSLLIIRNIYVTVFLSLIVLGVTIHLLSLKTLENVIKSDKDDGCSD